MHDEPQFFVFSITWGHKPRGRESENTLFLPENNEFEFNDHICMKNIRGHPNILQELIRLSVFGIDIEFSSCKCF